MIRLANVVRKFGPLEAVSRLSFEVARGEIFGLLGPDGAGKTTTLRMLCGLLDPTEGELSIDGLNVTTHIDEVKDRIGYMAQRFGLYADLTVEENMLFYSDLFGLDRRDRDPLMVRLLDMTRMAEFRSRPAGKLSGGMKQKLALMCTLLHKPRVLLLDEPTNGVDPLSRRDFWVILHALVEEGLTVLVTTAYLDEAERCDRLGLMYAGRLIRTGTPDELRESVRPLCYKVETSARREAHAWLQGREGVIGAEPAGAALHLYTGATQEALVRLSGSLAEATGAEASIQPIEPSLEDAFISLIRQEEHHV
jgi:ABC-2 type transport system ATP-binding protein